MNLPHFFKEPTGYFTATGLGLCLGGFLPDGFQWMGLLSGMAVIVISTGLFIAFHAGRKSVLPKTVVEKPAGRKRFMFLHNPPTDPATPPPTSAT